MKTALLFALLLPLLARAASPCGREGAIEERIKNCNLLKDNFVLVSRDEKGLEIYKDLKTGLLWGDRVLAEFNHFGSQKACDDIPESELLRDHKWRLPTVREFEMAASHGMKSALPRMTFWFWTSTPVKMKRTRRNRGVPTQAFLWDGLEEKSDVGDLKDAASVRCVSH